MRDNKTDASLPGNQRLRFSLSVALSIAVKVSLCGKKYSEFVWLIVYMEVAFEH